MTPIKLTKNQIRRVYEILKLAIANMENLEYLAIYKDEIKHRLYLANRMAFFPFLKKKYPYIYIDSKPISYNMSKIVIDEVVHTPLEQYQSENMPQHEGNY